MIEQGDTGLRSELLGEVRAEELKEGSWGADAAAEAVTRTVTATIVNHGIVAAAAQAT